MIYATWKHPNMRSLQPHPPCLFAFYLDGEKKKMVSLFCCGCGCFFFPLPCPAPSILGRCDVGASAECHLRDAAGSRQREEDRRSGRLFAGNVTAKGLCLDPVHEDKDTVASCFPISSAWCSLCVLIFFWPSSMRY